jgi:hypothetical protein
VNPALSDLDHDLSTWTKAALNARLDELEEWATPAGPWDIDRYLAESPAHFCGCGAPEVCTVDDYNDIDRALGAL